MFEIVIRWGGQAKPFKRTFHTTTSIRRLLTRDLKAPEEDILSLLAVVRPSYPTSISRIIGHANVTVSNRGRE